MEKAFFCELDGAAVYERAIRFAFTRGMNMTHRSIDAVQGFHRNEIQCTRIIIRKTVVTEM